MDFCGPGPVVTLSCSISSHLISHLVQSHPISLHLVQSHRIISSHLISSHVVFSQLFSPHLTSSHLLSRLLSSSQLIPTLLSWSQLFPSVLMLSQLFSSLLFSSAHYLMIIRQINWLLLIDYKTSASPLLSKTLLTDHVSFPRPTLKTLGSLWENQGEGTFEVLGMSNPSLGLLFFRSGENLCSRIMV